MQIRPWPKVQKFLPPLSSYERKELEDSIGKYGVQEPIIVWRETGFIIDGHHRWQICENGIPDEKIDYFSGSEEQAFTLAIELNLARRQLSNEQKREIALELRNGHLSQERIASLLTVDQSTVSRWQGNAESIMENHNAFTPQLVDNRVSISKDEYEAIYDRYVAGETQVRISADYKITRQRVGQIVKLVEARQNMPSDVSTPPFPKNRYRCLVVDPPWPTKKIEREERPNQGLELDYPTMKLDEIVDLPIAELVAPAGCHVYLWSTHKFLPYAFGLFEKWNINYQCLLTWVKPTGMTPFSWMYNTEHVLFGRIGNIDLLKYGIKLSFEESVRKHSAKPEKFYSIVREVSPEPRLELFARHPRFGFDVWGAEVDS